MIRKIFAWAAVHFPALKMNQAIFTTMNWSARSSWKVSRHQIVSAQVPDFYICFNNISVCSFYRSKCTYKSAGTPVFTKRRCFDRNAVHQVISMNFYQRPFYTMLAGILNNILRRKMCNISFLRNKYSNQCNFLCSKKSFNWNFKNKKSGTVQRKMMVKFYCSGSNNQIQEATELSETPIFHEESGKPIAPDPETCCETGCVHCVWIKYVEELQNYYPDGIQEEEVKDILKKIHDPLVRSFVKMELGA
ncbi:uncharacterized protein LOC117103795 [Anneissia japonica]|uniref:uncharacterized protein LOC117103795 n=1 Tax=Anneissia japonica TaxID=1529436 RepID=UPI0014259B9E|nr:uncharacterized protein LOC117103795 [Anneissia japonica]